MVQVKELLRIIPVINLGNKKWLFEVFEVMYYSIVRTQPPPLLGDGGAEPFFIAVYIGEA